jgi:dipeptidyl aminopeptidase/acylaminoacyl peptidase
MKSKTYRLKSQKTNKGSSLSLLLSVMLLISFLIIGTETLMHKIPSASGQFVPGENYTGEKFSRNLDLRVAAKNNYPSSSLFVVKKLGSVDGTTRSIIGFQVPVDGLTEYGLMVQPYGQKPAGGYPVIILCHGYANPTTYQTELNYLDDMEFYAKHGFVVIKPDYRGQGFSINNGQADSGYYSMAYNTDVMSLISALKKTSNIDKSNINLWGHSLGAYVALRAAVLSESVKNLVILSGPVDNISKMYLEYIPPSDVNNLNALKTRQNVFNKYGPPTENTVFWKNASPITHVSRIKAHIQINVGSLDQTVPPIFSADLNDALNENHISHEYYVYPDGEHSLSAQKDLIWKRSLQIYQPKTVTPPSST